MATDEQHLLIEYWKLRYEQNPKDTTRKQLTKAFRSANAVNEEVAFWKSRISRGEIQYSESELIVDLIKKSNSSCSIVGEVINICKVGLHQHPSNMHIADVLVKATNWLTEMEARIKLLKSAIELLKLSPSDITLKGEDYCLDVEMSREVLVEGLAQAIMEKGDDKYAVAFWITLVRKFPKSWSISEALQRAFVADGDDGGAMQFWRRMMGVCPKEQHFAYFYTESCKSAGEFEKAMKVWWLWLEYFLREVESPWKDFDCDTIVNNLNLALNFDHEPPEIIEIWESSIRKHPPNNLYDTRLECLSKALLSYSGHCPPDDVHNLLCKAAISCPHLDEIIIQLRASFEIIGAHLEGDFWKLQIETNDPLNKIQRSWYYARLAQFYSRRQQYEDVRSCIFKVEEMDAYWDWDNVGSLDIGSDSREFWRKIVERNPTCSSVAQLEKVCNSSQSSPSLDIQMWQSLVRENLSTSSLSWKLQERFQKYQCNLRKLNEEIEFWKECISMKPSDTGHLCNCLADTCKRKRERHDSNLLTALDAEITMWQTLLLEQGPEYAFDWNDCWSIPIYLDKAINSKVNAIGDNLQRALEVWKEAKYFWESIHSNIIGQSIKIKSKIKKLIDNASTNVLLLESKS